MVPEFDGPAGAYYSNKWPGGRIVINVGESDEQGNVEYDIRDAVFLQWSLATAIEDYAKDGA